MGRGLDGFFLVIPGVALCSFEGPGGRGLSPFSGGLGEGETPLPIPNRAVKPLSADGTWPARAWESRTPPVFSKQTADRPGGPFVVAWRSQQARVLRCEAVRAGRRRVVAAPSTGDRQTCIAGLGAPSR